MKHFAAIVAAVLLCASAGQAQTLKSLMYNFTNGQVVVATNINFTNKATAGGGFAVSGPGLEVDFMEGSGGFNVDLSSGAVSDGTNALFGFQGDWYVPLIAFSGITNKGNITVTQTTASNGLLFVYRTNNEAFLGLANLIASNNTTLSNETLFRVGIAEATNKSAQFGFRTVRTNNGGEGLAVFSVFGYNALMMIGPSDRSRTNTATNAGIEADIWTITPTNRVMTLRDTNSGAVTLHQELGWSTNNITTNAPANTTNVALWLRVWVGTNNYRLPLYQ